MSLIVYIGAVASLPALIAAFYFNKLTGNLLIDIKLHLNGTIKDLIEIIDKWFIYNKEEIQRKEQSSTSMNQVGQGEKIKNTESVKSVSNSVDNPCNESIIRAIKDNKGRIFKGLLYLKIRPHFSKKEIDTNLEDLKQDKRIQEHDHIITLLQ